MKILCPDILGNITPIYGDQILNGMSSAPSQFYEFDVSLNLFKVM